MKLLLLYYLIQIKLKNTETMMTFDIILLPVGLSVETPPALGSFGPIKIDAPSRLVPEVLEHHFPLVSFIC